MQGKLKKVKKTEPGSGSAKKINAQALYEIRHKAVWNQHDVLYGIISARKWM